MKFALIAIGYNRKNDYKRLVESLQKADYGEDTVDLILSIDNSGNKDITYYAEGVQWVHGTKVIRTFAERQGLRKHILQCGDYLDEYDAIAVFEDDIVVSPAFYQFAKKCYEKYSEDLNIAGISLYAHSVNVYANYPFIPQSSKYDVFFMKIAQSWGQVWFKTQWKEFKKWLQRNEGDYSVTPQMPFLLSTWGENSWLKYHMKYCIEENKYFVYPYLSLTTNFNTVGEHSAGRNNIYQVHMDLSAESVYFLPDFGDNSAVYYDAFFERERALSDYLGLSSDNLTVDLYGLKIGLDKDKRFLLSTRKCPYKIEKGIALTMIPHETNVIFDINGTDIFLYDTQKPCKHHGLKLSEKKKYVYYYKIYQHTRILWQIVISVSISKCLYFFKKICKQ